MGKSILGEKIGEINGAWWVLGNNGGNNGWQGWP